MGKLTIMGKLTVPVSWRLFFDGTVFALHGLAHLAVSPVLAAVALVLGEMLLILDLIIFQKFQKIRFLEGFNQAFEYLHQSAFLRRTSSLASSAISTWWLADSLKCPSDSP